MQNPEGKCDARSFVTPLGFHPYEIVEEVNGCNPPVRICRSFVPADLVYRCFSHSSIYPSIVYQQTQPKKRNRSFDARNKKKRLIACEDKRKTYGPCSLTLRLDVWSLLSTRLHHCVSKDFLDLLRAGPTELGVDLGGVDEGEDHHDEEHEHRVEDVEEDFVGDEVAIVA